MLLNEIALFIFIVLLSSYFSIKIAKKFKIYDYPSNERKIHKNPTLISGGLLIVISLSLYYTYLLINGLIDPSLRNNLILFIFPVIFFFLGIYDDKFDLNPNSKLILTTLVYLSVVLVDDNLQITKLRLSFTTKIFELENFSVFFSIFCFVVFLNALNMFDGINGQSAVYSIILLSLLFYRNSEAHIILLIIISLVIYLYFNLSNKMFLGDSGVAILSYIIATNFISQYNRGIIVNADLIFLYLSIPGFELIRLTFFRIIIGKHPFSADNNHLHHYLNKIYSTHTTMILIIVIYLAPIILNIFGLKLVYCILTSLILYSISVFVSYKKLRINKK